MGHVASALCVFGIGRALRARVLLRIEDHDKGRSRPEFDKAILEDLTWLGFAWDDDVTRQSERHDLYESTLQSLAQRTHVYGCDCTRKRIGTLEGGDGELRYDGHCRTRGLPINQVGIGVRIQIPDGEIAFTDGFLGPRIQRPAEQAGDLLVRERHGNWTYQFAAVVDDFVQGVNLVIRGQDLTESTGRQILLAKMLGRLRPAIFYHHALIHDTDGKKLSKRFYAEGVAKRREAGESAATVLGDAAYYLGLTTTRTTLAANDIPQLVASQADRLRRLLDGGKPT